jgi:adenylate kinase
MFHLVIFGPPGSGKGTQSVKIAEKYNFAHISTGNIFRKEIKNKTALGIRVQSIIEKGELVPDELLVELLEKAMGEHHGIDGFIFDGFPRTIQQAKDLDLLLNKTAHCVSLVLALEVDEDEVCQRLLKRAQEQGRKDDTEEVIRNRMEVYHRQTSPLMEYYRQQGKFESLYGVGSVDEIFENICKVIDKHLL